MVKVERLPGQTSGIGFVVPTRFSEPYTGWIADFVNSQGYGDSSKDVATFLLWEWFQKKRESLAILGINFGDAQKEGYAPVRFKRNKPPVLCNLHQEQPLPIELYGKGAYLVDRLVERRLCGTSRDEVVRRCVEAQILENFVSYSKIVDFRKR